MNFFGYHFRASCSVTSMHVERKIIEKTCQLLLTGFCYFPASARSSQTAPRSSAS